MNTSQQLVLDIVAAGARLQRRMDSALSGARGTTFSEYQLLRALLVGGATTRVELARQVGLTASGVTRALRPLEKLGYVTTERDVRDARRSLAALTPGGRELVEDADTIVADITASATSRIGLADADAAALGALLTQL